MNIQLAEDVAEIRRCYDVMRHLRELDDPEAFVARVQVLQARGYRLALARDDGRAVAVAGFVTGDKLAWGRHLYVDDLVTLPAARSRGHGAALLRWLAERGRAEECRQLHLDSGIQRSDAHRFYRREGLEMTSYHFRRDL